MASEQLLDDLVASLAPVRRRNPRREGLVLALIGAVELGLYLMLGHHRPDLMMAMRMPSFWWKAGCLGGLTVIGMITALRSFDPTASPRPGLRWMALLFGAALVSGWAIDVANAGGGMLRARLMWRHGVDCAIAIVILSIPVAVALGVMMRRGAPTDRKGSALAIGFAGAAWGAFVFIFQCPHDDPFYVAVWYSVGAVAVALIWRLILPRVTRW
ncbi:NrsF family protein [Sphingomonas sp. PR090111-T3T-6A]|uniref:NrsF family protein n=1 Tax=Sphingomonas sp. PR090111-T3T-6A TaxID=685778 RepID=UPI00036F23FB|nr:DUF1109 domain-containing protein [Sphingomonas sp. PR090111-T3T-6A]